MLTPKGQKHLDKLKDFYQDDDLAKRVHDAAQTKGHVKDEKGPEAAESPRKGKKCK